MKKLGEKMEHFRILNNNERDSREQIMSDILYDLFPPNRIFKKKKKDGYTQLVL